RRVPADRTAPAASRRPPTLDMQHHPRARHQPVPGERLEALALLVLEEDLLHLPPPEPQDLCKNHRALAHAVLLVRRNSIEETLRTAAGSMGQRSSSLRTRRRSLACASGARNSRRRHPLPIARAEAWPSSAAKGKRAPGATRSRAQADAGTACAE